jgi:glycosyltransferase involved in cell wall biosynthesis
LAAEILWIVGMNQIIKIMILNSSFHIGGAEFVIKNLSDHLDNCNFDVVLFYLKEIGSVGEELAEAGANVQGIISSKSRIKNYLKFISLYKFLKHNKIKVVHTHDVHSLVNAVMCKIIYLFSAQRLNIAHTFHYGNYPVFYKRRRYFLEKIFIRYADRLIAVGYLQKKKLIATFGIKESGIGIIWNGIAEIRPHSPSQVVGRCLAKKDKVIIGTIGTLYEQKGISYLIDVAFALKKMGYDCRFFIAGEGPLRNFLEDKRTKLDLEEEVVFLGWVKNASLVFLPHVDIYFQPSLWEAMSVVIIEAMMCAKPIVATRVGDNSLMIEDNKNGMLVEPMDVSAMVSKLKQLIDDPEKRNYIGNMARKKYECCFTASRMAEEYERVYREVSGRRSI